MAYQLWHISYGTRISTAAFVSRKARGRLKHYVVQHYLGRRISQSAWQAPRQFAVRHVLRRRFIAWWHGDGHACIRSCSRARSLMSLCSYGLYSYGLCSYGLFMLSRQVAHVDIHVYTHACTQVCAHVGDRIDTQGYTPI